MPDLYDRAIYDVVYCDMFVYRLVFVCFLRSELSFSVRECLLIV